MAWTQTDLDTIEAAIARGELSVSIDGRSVTYRSTADLLKARDAIKESLAGQAAATGTGGVMCRKFRFTKD